MKQEAKLDILPRLGTDVVFLLDNFKIHATIRNFATYADH